MYKTSPLQNTVIQSYPLNTYLLFHFIQLLQTTIMLGYIKFLPGVLETVNALAA